jgi:acetyl esterase/lipase
MRQPAPIAVYVHGGSWSSGAKNDWHGMIDAPELLSRGSLVASVDYRHAPEWKFPTQIEDVKCAIRFLRANAARFNLDPNRIGAWGHSAGGHLVSMLGTTDIGAGSKAKADTDQSSRGRLWWIGGRADLAGMPADKAISVSGVWGPQSISWTFQPGHILVTQDDPPFLILHGEQTPSCPRRIAELYDKLGSAGVPPNW